MTAATRQAPPSTAAPARASGLESTARMLAASRRSYTADPAEIVVGELDRPKPAEGEVLVRVHAAGLDRGVWHLMAGLPYLVRLAGFGLRAPKQPVLGLDLAGVVESVGGGVAEFRPGDRVYGVGSGSFAEYTVVEAKKLAPIPGGQSFEQAAAVPISGITALEAVRYRAKVTAGERVLILGASGGVGSFAVQIAKAEGATVTAVASGAKADFVEHLGADHSLDYRTDPLDRHAPYDAIIDIGGNRGLGRLRSLMTARGRLVIVGGENGGRLTGGIDRQLRAMLRSVVSRQKLGTFIASEDGVTLRRLSAMIESGHVRPSVDRTYPLVETPSAIVHMLDGKARGKIVITIR